MKKVNIVQKAVNVTFSPKTEIIFILAVGALTLICPEAAAQDLSKVTTMAKTAKKLIMLALSFLGIGFIVHGAIKKKNGDENWINSIIAGCFLAASPAIVAVFWKTANEDTTALE